MKYKVWNKGLLLLSIPLKEIYVYIVTALSMVNVLLLKLFTETMFLTIQTVTRNAK